MNKTILAGFATGILTICTVGVTQAALIHHYDFTSGVNDTVGGSNGVLVNGASVSGGALNLDGIDDYVQFSSHIVPTSGSYTVALFE